ncbi:MAG: hypothetical protein JNK10_02870 [Cyclobacteriaceae bacterium]|nr:hypothetical protein [Cyclobacteriaceae bacterium]
MKRVVLTFLVGLLTVSVMGQAGSEIYLFDLSAKKQGVSIKRPINITKRKGYDNQPSFHPSQPVIYYSSFNDEGRSDIWSYNYKTESGKPITRTDEREYSPTVTPDKEHLSCIIQRDNNAQDLGKYTMEGTEPSVIIDNMIVGYHVWADNSHLGLFVLGTPNTLHYLRLPTKKDTIVAENIGRSLHKIPGQGAISFVHKTSEKEWFIKKMNTVSMAISTVAPTLPGKEDICWLPDGRVLGSDGTSIFFLAPGPDPQWKKVEGDGVEILKGVTRLAVSADGKKLAVVVTEE